MGRLVTCQSTQKNKKAFHVRQDTECEENMVDLSNKCVITLNDKESEKLLRIAVSQGYSLPKGWKAMVGERIYRFIGFPLKVVRVLQDTDYQSSVWYSELFGDEDRELNLILESALRFCRSHGYSMLRIYADEEDDGFEGSATAKSDDGEKIKTDVKIPKPRKITLDEIEKKFGGPIEIIF